MVFPFKTYLQPEHDNARFYMIRLLTTVQPLLVPCSLHPARPLYPSHIQHSKQTVVFWIYQTSSCLLPFVHFSPPAWNALSALSFRQTPIPALGRRQVLPPLCSLLESPLWILSSVSPGTVCILNPHPELELSTSQLLSTGMNKDFVARSYSSDGTDTVAASWSRLFSFESSQPLRAQWWNTIICWTDEWKKKYWEYSAPKIE